VAPIPWNPDRKTLSEFSEAWLFVFGMVAAPWALWKGHTAWAVGFWVAAVAVRALGLLRPALVRPIFVGLTVATWPIGWMVSNLVLAIVYYGTMTPIGLIRRWRNRDPLGRELDREATSHWAEVRPDTRPDRFFRQF
jgi:Saxitoxin biosynthesis operon protein SxtJ